MTRRHAVGLWDEPRVPDDEFGWEQAAGDERALAVEVGKDQVEQLSTLGQASLEVGPVPGGHDEGHRIDDEVPVQPRQVRPDEDAVVLDEPPGDVATAHEFARRHPCQRGQEVLGQGPGGR